MSSFEELGMIVITINFVAALLWAVWVTTLLNEVKSDVTDCLNRINKHDQEHYDKKKRRKDKRMMR